MKRTFVTVMPNHIGAFLKASRCFAEIGVNITRVSYNKAVDSHMLFIDAEGTADKLDEAARRLTQIGYLQCDESGRSVILLEFRLRDVPGSVTAVLELISEFSFNISYISSQENGSDYQYFKMGIVAGESERLDAFLAEAGKLCTVRVIDYNRADKIYDNSVFYIHFADQLSSLMQISADSREALLVNTNLAMQQLDESGVSPYRTFDSISRFCELLSKARGADFTPRITEHRVTDNTDIILIEPPCGSNTAIIRSGGRYLFVDTGYAYCRAEMRRNEEGSVRHPCGRRSLRTAPGFRYGLRERGNCGVSSHGVRGRGRIPREKSASQAVHTDMQDTHVVYPRRSGEGRDGRRGSDGGERR